MMDLVKQSYWDESYCKIDFNLYDEDNPIVLKIKAIIKKGDFKYLNVLEIGCIPGRFLPVFAEFDIELNGIDTNERVFPDFYNYLVNKNYKVGSIEKKRIEDLDLSKKYDIVCSFGFIEHYIDFKKIIQIHSSILAPSGLIIISVPNFSGFIQYLFRVFFDRENLRRHNLKSMNVKAWYDALDKISFKYDILFEGPIGGIEFWTDSKPVNKILYFISNKVIKYTKILNKKGVKDSNLYSPYKMIVLRKAPI